MISFSQESTTKKVKHDHLVEVSDLIVSKNVDSNNINDDQNNN